MTNYRKKQNQTTILEALVLGIFRLIAGIFKLIFKGFKTGKGLSTSDKQNIINKRRQIDSMSGSNNIHELKQAVMEADKLVDFILMSYGYRGDTFADRLRNAEQFIDRDAYNQIWQGHKVRNQIAHDHDLQLNPEELRSATKKLLNFTRRV